MTQPPFDEPLGAPANQGLGFHIGDYLHVLQRHWRVAALATLICALAASIHYLITPKLYRAATTLQIERRSLTSITGDQNPWLENYWNLEYYPTQYRLLQSRGLAERVVVDLRLMEDSEFNPGAAAVTSTPSAEGDRAALGALGARLLGGLTVTPINQTQLVEVAYVSANPRFAAQVANGFAQAFIDWGIATRSETAGKASTFLGSQIETLKQEIQDKESQLQAYARRSDIVALDPGSNVLLQRLEGLNQDYIGAVAERINKEARHNELLNTSPEALADTLAAGLVGTLRSEQIGMEREYATKLQTYKPDWPAMVELKAKIDKGRQNLDSVVGETVSKARESARSEYQTALRREQSLAAELNRTKSDAMQLNSAAVEYNNLKLEVSTRRQLLDEMLRKQSETEVASRLQGARESNVHVVDEALVPGTAFRPSLRKDLSLGLALGLALGVGIIFLLEYLDRTIKHPDEMERLLALPTLGVIPDTDESASGYGYRSRGYGYGYGYGAARARRRSTQGKGWLEKKAVSPEETPIELVPHDRPRLVVSEAYRSLRTALLLSSARELKVVAVTSAGSGEGKTSTATNLAVVMAQLGRRVLLVDGDLRRPRLHEIFRLPNRSGVVNFLTGSAGGEQIFLATGVPNLFVAPSGPTPPNPSELLASTRMSELVTMARSSFDFVVIDSPPVLAVTDAILIGSIVDGTVVCLRSRKVLRDDARACRDRLRLSEVRLLGTVLNRYREVQGRYGKRYHHYAAYAAEKEADSRAKTAASA